MKLDELVRKMDFAKMEGLIPVIAQDYKTGKILMLAFMNGEALKKTINEGKVTYWSRTRKKLWTKGETSGHYQYLKEIRPDCDNDTLLVKVKQIGKACHEGYDTCFFRKIKYKKLN